jgi:hypothetical protein
MRDSTILNFKSVTDAAKFLKVTMSSIVWCLNTDGIYCGLYGPQNKTEKWLWKIERNNPLDKYIAFEQNEIQMEGFRHLVACSNGIIFNKQTKKQVGTCYNGRYIRVQSSKINGVNIQKRAHQLIAHTFIPNPENKPFINHIDGITTNNSVENLEWVTHKENMIHARQTGLFNETTTEAMASKMRLAIHLLELDGTILKTFESSGKLGEYLNCQGITVREICRNFKFKKHDRYTINVYGCCYTTDYYLVKNPVVDEVFPELKERNDIDYELIRPYIAAKTKPIFQIDIDGSLIKKWDNYKKDILPGIEVANTTFCNALTLSNDSDYSLSSIG